ncbi:UNVERIFIED_CONTAM: hypothetical protein FKN15_054841 [Acipenser sinensis]
MESIEELIKRINRKTAAQIEQTARYERWAIDMGLAPPKIQEREPTELERLIQAWELLLPEPRREEPPLPEPTEEKPPLPEPRGEEPPLPEPRGEELLLPEPRGEELPLPEPRGEELPLPEPRGEELLLPEPRGEEPPLPEPIPHPLLLDTLPVFLDLPVLDLEPRSLQHWPQLCPWFPAPLSPSTQTSLGCCQTSRSLLLFAASLPLGDRTSLRRFPGEDLCPLLYPPVPRSMLRSPLSNRWVPSSPGRGPYLVNLRTRE